MEFTDEAGPEGGLAHSSSALHNHSAKRARTLSTARRCSFTSTGPGSSQAQCLSITLGKNAKAGQPLCGGAENFTLPQHAHNIYLM